MRAVGFFIFALILFSASCDILELEVYSAYPIKINPLQNDDLIALNEEYQNLNQNHICSTLNEFGFTGFSRILFPNDINPCLSKEIIRVELTQPDTLITLAKRALLKNEKFTVITDTSKLELKEISPLYGCTICEGPLINSVPIEYKIVFDNQRIDKFEVINSEITVFVDAVGVNRIWGNWFPEVRTQSLINVGYIQAKEVVKGWEIDMSRITGENYVFKVTDEYLNEQPTIEYIQFIKNETLELRKTWRVSISYKDESYPGWIAHVDLMEGTLLQIEEKVVF